VVYGVALVQLRCNKTGKYYEVVVLTAKLAENHKNLSSKREKTVDEK